MQKCLSHLIYSNKSFPSCAAFLGRRVEYVEVPRMGHRVNLPLSVSLKRLEFIAGLL